MSKKYAELKIGDKIYNLPIIKGTESDYAIDISSLRSETGFITIDYGFKNTGSTESKITFIDGEKGILRYRGYDIDDLAENSTFLEVAYLLIYGDLPNKLEHDNWKESIVKHTLVHEDVKSILDGFPSNSHPMGILSSLVSSLTAFYPKSLDPNRSYEEVNGTIKRILAKLPTIAAWSYRKKLRFPVVYPKNELDYCANFLNMMFSMPSESYDVNPIHAKALDKLLILHADHEQNCSTATVRVVGSAHASIYASVSAGINALWGPKHGGANQGVIEMLQMIKEDNCDYKKYIAKAKDKNDDFRLMGFGHRVYKNFDPRAKIIKDTAGDVLKSLGVNDPVLDIAQELEAAALKDDYFVSRKLYPNVDFYSGIIYKALNIPVQMFTVMFALGRLPGWLAQWKEMRKNHEPIGRPRQVYIGKEARKYISLDKR